MRMLNKLKLLILSLDNECVNTCIQNMCIMYLCEIVYTIGLIYLYSVHIYSPFPAGVPTRHGRFGESV